MIVVKVGGSLYDWPGLGPALVILVHGGGGFADGVRKTHAVHGLTEEQSHWLALEAVQLGGFLLHHFLPEAKGIGFPDLAPTSRVAVLDAPIFAHVVPDLPHTWEVTTDSIAARAAVVWKADRLILLKSVDVPPGTSWDEAAARGWVDGYFTRALAGFAGRVEAINLRTWGGIALAGHSG